MVRLLAWQAQQPFGNDVALDFVGPGIDQVGRTTTSQARPAPPIGAAQVERGLM